MLKKMFVAGLIALATAPAAASATRSTPASVGRGQDEACFRELFYSSVKNRCPIDKLFDIPLVIDQSGVRSAVVAAEGPTSDAVRCRIVVLSNLGVLHSEGLLRGLGGSPGPSEIRLEGAYSAIVPPDGAAYISCVVKPGGIIRKVNTW